MQKKVRYAVVGLGDISQEAMLPGIAATGNSELVALVTSDPEKARRVGKQYGIEATYDYTEFQALLDSGTIDAIYLGTPNWRHAEFIIPALAAGVHILTEKPLEITAAKCREIVDAQKASRAKLMVAYRLHFEPATLDLIDTIRSGELGDVLLFTSTFAQVVDPENHRAHSGDKAGPLLDMGPYPINASRYVFEAEPIAVVSAIGTRHPESGFGNFDDTVAVTLEFPGARLAQFVVSYYANAIDMFCALGTKGSVIMNPSYLYGVPLEHDKSIGAKKQHKAFKNTDHFGGEMKYFSDCILNDVEPEPGAEEGYADVRVIEGIFECLKTGTRVELPPFSRSERIDTKKQLQTMHPHSAPKLVHASNPGRDLAQAPLN